MNFNHLSLPKFACGTNCHYTDFCAALVLPPYPNRDWAGFSFKSCGHTPGLEKEMINHAELCMGGIFKGIQ
jgi:hypothetical protein